MTDPARPSRPRDHGQAGVLCLGVIVVLLIATQQLARLGGVVVDAARAQSVADAVALAAVDRGETFAFGLSQRNGAEVVSIIESSGTVDVVVTVRDAVGRARASNIDLP